MFRFYILTIAFIISFDLAAQNTGVEIGFKDYHTAQITDIRVSEDGTSIYTSDEAGKIIQWDSRTKDFEQTVKKAEGLPVFNFQIVRGKIIASQKFRNGFKPEEDSLKLISLSEPEEIITSQLSFELVDLHHPDYFGVLIRDPSIPFQNLFQVMDRNLSEKGRLLLQSPQKIAVSQDLKQIAYISDYPQERTISITDFASQKLIQSFSVPENLKVAKLFFDPSDGKLYSIAVRTDNSSFEIDNLSLPDPWDTPIYSANQSISHLNDFSIKASGDKLIIVSNNPLPYTQPLILVKEGAKVTSLRNDFAPNKNFTKSVINPTLKEIYFVDNEVSKYGQNSDFNSQIAAITVYNYESQESIARFPEINNGFYSAAFLPDGSWIASPNGLHRDISETEIKLFEKGTFEERYHSLGLKNYLQVHSDFSYIFSINLFEKQGIAVVLATKKGEDFEGFYRYDFINDESELIAPAKNSKYIKVQDYHKETNQLLLSDGKYANYGHTPSIQMSLVSDSINREIPGEFKFGKFSNDGTLLLTIDKNEELKVWSLPELNPIYTMNLREGAYEIFSIDQKGFAVTNQYRVGDINDCIDETVVLDFENETDPKVQRNKCITLNSVDSKNGKTVSVFNNQTIRLDSQMIPLDASDKPVVASFNDDASRLMVSFLNGKIAVYDARSLKPLAYMMHPDRKTHLFWDSDNHYFSNTDVSRFIYAKKDGQTTALAEVDTEIFRPDILLEKFGEPNLAYLKTLDKAMALRAANLGKKTDEQPLNQEDNDRINSGKKPDLYLLSVGVSDYKDKVWSLTLPEKDATDMIRIYGHLEDDARERYDNHFFGQKYTLTGPKGEVAGSIEKFWDSEMREPLGIEAYSVNKAGTRWFIPNDPVSYLFDFEKGIIDTTTYEGNSWSINREVFVRPDGQGFYLSEAPELFLEYSFKNRSFQKHARPFASEDTRMKLLDNGNWLGVEGWNFQIKNAGGKLLEEFNLSEMPELAIRRISEEGATVEEEFDFYGLPQFNGSSADGKYIFISRVIAEGYELILLDRNKKNPEMTILPVIVKYGTRINIDGNRKVFSILSDDFKNNSIFLTQYDFAGKVLSKKELKSNQIYPKNYEHLTNSDPDFITKTPSLFTKSMFDSFLSDGADALEKFEPASFEKIHTKLLTNSQADFKSIRAELGRFFKNAKKEDQVMVFLAGHGVLDSQHNYFFAPHDMDFNEVGKRGVAFETILKGLQSSAAQNKILLMDACHSGQIIDLEPSEVQGTPSQVGEMHREDGERGSVVAAAREPDYKVSQVISTLFSDFMSQSGVTILSAASGGDLAQEHKDWGGGAFTQSFIKILEERLKRADSGFGEKMDQVFSTLKLDQKHADKTVLLTDSFVEDWFKTVVEITNGKQTPDLREKSQKSQIMIW